MLKRLLLEVFGEEDGSDEYDGDSKEERDMGDDYYNEPAPSTIATEYQKAEPEEKLKGDLDQKVRPLSQPKNIRSRALSALCLGSASLETSCGPG